MARSEYNFNGRNQLNIQKHFGDLPDMNQDYDLGDNNSVDNIGPYENDPD